jgi:hypothetical protein
MCPFEGIKILDCNEPDQSRESGADHALNKAMMGTGFLPGLWAWAMRIWHG